MTEHSQLGPSRDGTVLLDIGGDIGALVIQTGAAMSGAEIEVSPAGSDSARTHAAVRERLGNGPTRYAAVYPALHAGTYTVWGANGTPGDSVTIVGGQVAELDWR